MTAFIAEKAVLIYPQFDTQDTFWSYSESLGRYAEKNHFGGAKRLLPPLGLLGLYNHLKPYYRQIELIDKNVDPRPLSEQIADAEHVYLGGMSAQQRNLYRDTMLVKRYGKRTIVGGTAVTQDSPLLDIADHLVENEAELVIDELLQGLADGTAKHYYKGGTSPPERFFQPDFSAIDLRDYAHMALQISRGCPESCEFCDIPTRFGKNYRVTPWQRTEAAFRQLTELGWHGPVFIVDDNFIGNPRQALETLKQLYRIGERLGIHHPKYTELTLRFADDNDIMRQVRHWFRRCHFTQSFYGVETPNRASLRETDKRQNLSGATSLAEKLTIISEQTGSGVMMGMIYGFDHDNDETVEPFIDFINATHAPIVMAGLLNALPHTALMKRLKQEGRFVQLSSGNNSDGVINFIPMELSIRQAEQNYIKILQAIYHPEAYFKRVMRYLQHVDPLLKNEFRSRKEQMVALCRVFTGPHAAIFWRYLFQACSVAGRRFSPGSRAFNGVIGEYIALCAQYTHFIGQTRNVTRQVGDRRYEPWQCVSWRQVLEAKIASVELLYRDSKSVLLDVVCVRLQPINYALSGTRLRIMNYFAEPIIEQGFVDFDGILVDRQQCRKLQITALEEVRRNRPEILPETVSLDLERELSACLPLEIYELRQMRKRYRKFVTIQELQNVQE